MKGEKEMLRVGRTGWTWMGLGGEINGIYKVGRWEKLAQKYSERKIFFPVAPPLSSKAFLNSGKAAARNQLIKLPGFLRVVTCGAWVGAVDKERKS